MEKVMVSAIVLAIFGKVLIFLSPKWHDSSGSRKYCRSIDSSVLAVLCAILPTVVRHFLFSFGILNENVWSFLRHLWEKNHSKWHSTSIYLVSDFDNDYVIFPFHRMDIQTSPGSVSRCSSWSNLPVISFYVALIWHRLSSWPQTMQTLRWDKGS